MENRKFGALWSRKNKDGGEYYSGELIINDQKIKIVCFKRTEKKNEKEPDWDILVGKDKEEGLKV
jgi:hypothetical protein